MIVIGTLQWWFLQWMISIMMIFTIIIITMINFTIIISTMNDFYNEWFLQWWFLQWWFLQWMIFTMNDFYNEWFFTMMIIFAITIIIMILFTIMIFTMVILMIIFVIMIFTMKQSHKQYWNLIISIKITYTKPSTSQHNQHESNNTWCHQQNNTHTLVFHFINIYTCTNATQTQQQQNNIKHKTNAKNINIPNKSNIINIKIQNGNITRQQGTLKKKYSHPINSTMSVIGTRYQ